MESSGMIQVFSLPDFEAKGAKDKEWFLYQKDGWEVIKAESDTQVSPDCENYEDSLSPAEQSSAISALSPESDDLSTQSNRAIVKAKRWRNPNPSAEPLYATPTKNIFMRLQSKPFINYTKAPMKEITFGKPIPPPDDLEIMPDDSKYLTYFVTEVPDILGSDRFFPSAITTIFKQSVNQPVLRHSILAVSSWMTDNRQGRLPLYTLRHLERILPGIQKAIMDLNINTGHIVSVSFLSWLSLMTGDLYTTHRHLKGLFLMYLETRHLNIVGEPYDNPDPLIMFLYRMSLKIDNTLAYRNYPLAYPVITNHDRSHRQWLAHYLSKEIDVEHCLATFRLDDFTNQICHLHIQARELRKQNESNESQIHDRAKTIAVEHNAWLNLPVVRPHIHAVEGVFPVTNQSPTSEDAQFLHYPPYEIKDVMFGQMLMIHASLGIHLNIVITGKLGPYPRTRYEYAVQVCRIYAALGSSRSTIEKTGQSRMINSLWLAGLVLGRDCYPAAYQWIIKSLLDLDRNRGYRAASKLVDALNETWSKGGECDAWDIVGRIFDVSWKMLRNDYTGDTTTDTIQEYTEWRDPLDLDMGSEVYS